MDKPEARPCGKPHGTAAARATPYSGAAFKKTADRYFALCDSEGKLYSEAGLCLALQGHRTGERTITPAILRSWYDDNSHPALRAAVRSAYLRMQQQIETDERYWEKSGIASRAAQLLSLRCFGGETQPDRDAQAPRVQVVFDGSVEASDFQ